MSSLRAVVAACALFAALPAAATNGYFAHGYGAAAQGLGGAGIALPQDALAAATNPAGTGATGDLADLGLVVFVPRRGAAITGNAFAPDASYDGDGKRTFYIPEFGIGRRWTPAWSWGVAAYGNGGLNTTYRDNPYARFGATGTAGVNLEQLFVTPSLAYRPAPEQSLGVALNVAVQRFSAQGIGIFDAFSSSPGNVSDRGTDTTTGAGLRLGWQGQVAPRLVLGATWAQKIRGRFDRYRGLFADGGRFDVPENYGLGLAWSATPAFTAAFDLQRILYGDVAAVGNSAAALFAGTPLGSKDGPGFGWRDITVAKVGLQWRVSDALTLRAGASTTTQPVPRSETFFNILAPGVVRRHWTFGAAGALAGASLSGFVAIAPKQTVRGSGSIPPGTPPAGLGGGEADVRLKETIVGLSYGWSL